MTDNAGCVDSFCYSTYLSRMDINATMITVNVISTATGINQLNINDDLFSLFPNPFSNQLIVKINNNNPAEIIIHDMTSRKYLQQSFINSVELNTEQLARGIYLYEVRNKKGIIKKGKIVKD